MRTRDTQSPAAGAPGQAEGPKGRPHAPSPPLSGRRVAMVTPDYPPDVIGGAGVSCHLLVQQLRERGLIVDVYALTERGPGRRQARPEPSAGVDAPGGTDVRLSAGGGRVGRNLRAFAALRGRLGDYDLVHVYDASLLPAAALIRCLGRPCLKRAAPPRRGQGRPRAPVVMHLNNLQGACFTPELCLKEQCDRHGWLKSIRCAVVDPEPTSRLRRLLLVHPMFHIVNRIGRLAPAFIAISADLKARYVAAGFCGDRIVVAPNMLDERLFAPREVGEKEAGGDGLNILYVGQLDHRKGVQDLVAAYGRLPGDVRGRARLTILGAGKEEAALRDLVSQCDIGDRVEIRHCPYEHLPEEYAAADVFVKPACWPEPFGRTCLEALAFGLPVVAADVPSAREILAGSAVYYQPFDVDDLAAKLRQVIEGAELRRDIGAGAAGRLEQYMPSAVVGRILELYERRLEGR